MAPKSIPMKHPLIAWRSFVVGLGYWRAALLHSCVILPPVFLAWWVMIFHLVPKILGTGHSVALSIFVSWPLVALWTMPAVVVGLLIWPLCWLGIPAAARKTNPG